MYRLYTFCINFEIVKQQVSNNGLEHKHPIFTRGVRPSFRPRISSSLMYKHDCNSSVIKKPWHDRIRQNKFFYSLTQKLKTISVFHLFQSPFLAFCFDWSIHVGNVCSNTLFWLVNRGFYTQCASCCFLPMRTYSEHS